jgi:outer membrane receptor protein involved in Fe transport
LLSAACAFAQTGALSGTIYNAANGQPVAGASVALKELPSLNTKSGTDGRFNLAVAPGKYTLVVKAGNFQDTEIESVEVKSGEPTDVSTVLAPQGQVTTVDVVEKVSAVAANAEAMLTERRLAASVSDGISAEEIRNTVASDAAGAVEKVTGVSIVDQGYVYVRGLGERYSATMLNNALIPTTEPERRVVPLDLFPASLIDSIKVLKTYTPDLPGEFSGGLVQMQTVEFPTKKLFRAGLSYGFNSRTTFQRFDTHRGGSRDFFGFDDGARSIPSLIPQEGRIFPGQYTPQQVQQFGQAFSTNWEPEPIQSMRPSQTYNIAAGNTWGRMGLIGAITFSNTPQRYAELQRYLTTAGGRPIIFSDYDKFNADSESVRLGGVLNAAFRLNPANKLIFRNTLTRDSDKETRTFSGLNGGLDATIQAQRLRYIERGLVSTSVEGEHQLTRIGGSILRWQYTYSSSRREEPDLREIIRTQDLQGRFIFSALPQSAFRFYNSLKDGIHEPQVDWAKPWFMGKINGIFRLGYRASLRERDFNSRRFRYNSPRTIPELFSQPSNQLLASANIRPDLFNLLELTRGTDAYSASMDIHAGYGMLDVNLTPKLRVIGGVRVEDADIGVLTIDPFVPGGVPARASLVNRDALPGVNAIYALTSRQNLRAGYGRTLSRPDFRELSPFEFLNVLGGFSVAGNPRLQRSKIDNFDVRWEWFPGGDQVIAASYFYKRFTDPVEVFVTPTTAELLQGYFNAPRANNQGLELEFRRSLRFLGDRFKSFSTTANFTVVDSDVTLGDDPFLRALTTRNRPLLGQSRFIYNFILDWAKPQWRSSSRFFVNSVSRRITSVGALTLPDIYQERNTFMDFVYQYEILEGGRWNLRFSAENLTDNTYRWTQGDILVRRYQMGRTFSIGTSFSFF